MNLRPIELLALGPQAWNSWRAKHPSWHPNLAEAQLQRASLEGFDLSGADLRGARLQGALLTNSRLVRARLEAARLEEADLSYADLKEARLIGTFLQKSSLRGVDFRKALLLHSHLDEADLSYADFRAAQLCQSSLKQTRLCATRFERALLENCQFTGGLFLQSPPVQVVLEGIDVLILEEHILLDHPWSFLNSQIFTLSDWVAALKESSNAACVKATNQAVPGWWERWAGLVIEAAVAADRQVPAWRKSSGPLISGPVLLGLSQLCLERHWKLEEELERVIEHQPQNPIGFIETWHHLEESSQGLR